MKPSLSPQRGVAAAPTFVAALAVAVASVAWASDLTTDVTQGSASAAITYPPAARGDVIDDYHGTKVPDPYRWLEDLDSPATVSWINAESALTDRLIAELPLRKAFANRIRRLYDYERFGLPFRGGRRYFYDRNSGLQDQSVLYSADGLDGKARVAFDPNTLSHDGSLGVSEYVASRDGRLLAYGVSVSGSDWTDWHVRDITSGRDLPGVIRHTKYYAPAFSADGRRLYYSAFHAPAPGTELDTQDLGNAVYVHLLGRAEASDRKLLEIAGHADWQYKVDVSEDGRWLVVTAGEGEVGDEGLENVYLIDLAAAQADVIPVIEGFPAAYEYVGEDAGRLFFLTSQSAPNGKVVALDPSQPGKGFVTVVGEALEAIDLTETSVTLVDHRLVVRTIKDAHSEVVVYDLDGQRRGTVQLPGTGTATGFEGLATDRYTFYSFTDLVTPPTVYRYDVATGESRVYRKPVTPFESGEFEQRQVFYPGKDGVRIPMLLAYRKGLKLDGVNPLVLYGYGGFGIPLLPEFDPARLAWLEQGGVYAIANIRGGGEYGEAWHRAANRAHKQVVFDDFMAAAEWLIAGHYTSSTKIAIQGDSNGGLLVGACLTQRPDLFGAVIAGVGVMDMLRFDRFGQGTGWTGEYGSPQDAADFPALYAYSPLHHVRPGTKYPATLIITGDHDTRVMPAHSFKFAAALQAAQAGPAPVLLDIEKSSGHGGGTTISQAIEQNAAIYAFLAQQLGLSGAAPQRLDSSTARSHEPR
jgi:prolyl oligopeptidase